MISYLIKVTIIWVIFLCLYEWLFRRNPSFTLNRLYLFGALAVGLIVPLIALDIPLFQNKVSGITARNNGIQNLDPAITTSAQHVDNTAQTINWYSVIKWLYIAGAALFALMSFREVILIIRTAIYGRFIAVQGHKIFSSEKRHAPFSFMGWIFISCPEQYTDQELNYILNHEDAHNSQKHWLDAILMQLIIIIFWFHPLVWCFRQMVKLTHEYEADHMAAVDNAYDYGHFLLQQTLLKGTPGIAHSFHFSPIKNRITMLTNTKKKNSWKYLFAIPVLLTCTFVFAKSNPSSQRVRVGNVTTYNGHRFFWGKDMVDSVQVVDPVTGETTWVVTKLPGRIYKMDNDSVYSEEEQGIRKAEFKHQNQDFYEYVSSKFKEQFSNFPDSIRSINIWNIVIDELGKVVYYDMRVGVDWKYYDLSSAGPDFATYSKTIEKIIGESPDWTPAMSNGKNIKVTMPHGFNVFFKPMKARLITPAKK
ncbi:MAG: M56 family metallopeptidase [Taibaiella sp.]|jgi:hypothetical protein